MNPAFNRYMYKVTIDVTEFCNGEKHSIVLKEPETADYRKLSGLVKKLPSLKDNPDMDVLVDGVEGFSELLPKLIVDHDFTEENNPSQKLSSKDVADWCSSKLDVLMEVIGKYLPALPLLRRTAGK